MANPAPKKKKGKWNYYKIEGTKVSRLKQSCPKCGHGTFLAQHKNRVSCGKCGYSEIQKGK